MPRIELTSADSLSPEQRAVYEKIVSGPRGTLVGPLRAALHVPELADRWQHLGEFIRYKTSLSPALSELAILVTAKRWNSQMEWFVHAKAGAAAGLSLAAIEALRQGQRPDWDDPDQQAIYEYSLQIQQTGFVSDAIYDQVLERLGTRGIVELTAVLGYYTMVAMTLNAHQILPVSGERPLS